MFEPARGHHSLFRDERQLREVIPGHFTTERKIETSFEIVRDQRHVT